jgi:chromosome segregation ATPase
MNKKRLITLLLSSSLLGVPVYLAARQDQAQGQESVADAARRAQAARKTAPQAKLSIDNDNLGTLTGTISVVGEAPAPPDDLTKKAEDKAAKPAGTEPKSAAKDEAYWRDKFAAANKKLADDEHELDITQREFNLKQQQFYTDPMASLKQDYSRQDINDSKTKIDEKTAAVAQDKADISSLEDELRMAGGDPGWATAGAQPQQSGSAPATSPPSTTGAAPSSTTDAPPTSAIPSAGQ